MSLPPLSGAPDRATLTDILSTLFEPSAALRDELVPAVLAELSAPPPTYNALVHACAAAAAQWSYAQKSDFVSGHPMIGEVGGLSALSAREQASKATRPVVLERLAHLNALYNSVYPGLRFITFVNGRSRAEIVNVIEDAVGIPRSPEPLPDEYPVNTPALDSDEIRRLRRDPVSAEWRTECDRAVGDVWLIAKARIRGLGLE